MSRDLAQPMNKLILTFFGILRIPLIFCANESFYSSKLPVSTYGIHAEKYELIAFQLVSYFSVSLLTTENQSEWPKNPNSRIYSPGINFVCNYHHIIAILVRSFSGISVQNSFSF